MVRYKILAETLIVPYMGPPRGHIPMKLHIMKLLKKGISDRFQVKFILLFVWEIRHVKKYGFEERNYGWDPHILARPANSTLSHIIIKSRKKCVSGRLIVKVKHRNGSLIPMFAQKPSTRGKHNHNFIFFHILPQSGLVGIEVWQTRIWCFARTLVPEPNFSLRMCF